MDFIDIVKQYSQRIEMVRGNLATEEATKTALIMPFFNLLGYDIFNPMEFIPEYVADVGTKKGEKVDYAIMSEGKPVILIEAKGVDDGLTKHDAQLFRYFTVTEAKFAILTNGIVYKFFTDLEEPNKMDEKPFLVLDLLNINDMQVAELKKFTKDKFDIDTIFNTASELKYSNLIKAQLNNQLNSPSDEFVRFIIGDFFTGVKTANVVEKFRPIVKKSMQQFVNEFMNDKIKSILNSETEEVENVVIEEVVNTEEIAIDENIENKVVTTEEELEGFNIVRSILSEVVSPEEIIYKDVERYCGILYQNNTRKWICRLYFNSAKKSITIADDNKKEVRYYLENISDIYQYKNQLLNSIEKYLGKADA
ncbi:MAG: type I restriction endonuclease [Terrisporobacter sp.]